MALDPSTVNSLINLGGNILGGYGQGQMASANANASQTQQLQNLIQQNFQQNQALGQQQAQAGLGATQLNPAAQSTALSNALVRGNILSNLRPSSFSGPSWLSNFTPQLQGGLMGAIPQGGFGADITSASSPQGILASANQFQRAQAVASPNTPTMDLGPAFGSAGTQSTDATNAFRQNQLANQQGSQSARTNALNSALQQAQQESQGSGGFWSKLLPILGAAGSIVAAPFTAGTSLAWLPAAIGAGTGAAAGAMNGGGGDAIVGGLTGGLGGYAMGQMNPLKSVLNPVNASTYGGSYTGP